MPPTHTLSLHVDTRPTNAKGGRAAGSRTSPGRASSFWPELHSWYRLFTFQAPEFDWRRRNRFSLTLLRVSLLSYRIFHHAELVEMGKIPPFVSEFTFTLIAIILPPVSTWPGGGVSISRRSNKPVVVCRSIGTNQGLTDRMRQKRISRCYT